MDVFGVDIHELQPLRLENRVTIMVLKCDGYGVRE
jgi:hypothetical protein